MKILILDGLVDHVISKILCDYGNKITDKDCDMPLLLYSNPIDKDIPKRILSRSTIFQLKHGGSFILIPNCEVLFTRDYIKKMFHIEVK